MPSNATRLRIDWTPGDAAIQALEIGEGLFPNLNRQAVIDRLVITGLAAYLGQHWRPPPFLGSHRDRWSLPTDLIPQSRSPGNSRLRPTHSSHFPGMQSATTSAHVYCAQKEPSNEQPSSNREPVDANPSRPAVA